VKAMILAAGVGERMRPLTEHTPKPLLRVGGAPLLAYHLRGLAAAGLRDVVINVSHLAAQVMDFCGDGGDWGLRIRYSPEPEPLETAGGICRALPLLGAGPFLVVNGDIWTDFPFAAVAGAGLRDAETARLVLVDSPPQHAAGDFLLDDRGWVRERPAGRTGLTYAGMGVYRPEFFAGMQGGKLPLRPLLDAAIAAGTLGGEHYAGRWHDIGTPERLAALDRMLRSESA